MNVFRRKFYSNPISQTFTRPQRLYLMKQVRRAYEEGCADGSTPAIETYGHSIGAERVEKV